MQKVFEKPDLILLDVNMPQMDGFAYCYIRKKVGRKEWIDLRNRLWFANKPQSVKLMGIDFCTEDGIKLYPRILSKYIDEKTYLTVKTLELQVGTGLSWKHRFIPWDEPNKVYLYKEGSVIFECKDGAYQPLSAEDILEVAQEEK